VDYLVIMFAWCFQSKNCYIPFNILFINSKTFFRRQKYLTSLGFHQHLNYWCKHHIFITKNQLWAEWWCLVSVSNQSIVIFNFCMLLLNETSFFRSQKDLNLTYLWALGPLDIWLVISFYQKNTCTVNGVVCFMFQANLLLYSLFNMFLMTVKSSFRS